MHKFLTVIQGKYFNTKKCDLACLSVFPKKNHPQSSGAFYLIHLTSGTGPDEKNKREKSENWRLLPLNGSLSVMAELI